MVDATLTTLVKLTTVLREGGPWVLLVNQELHRRLERKK